MKQKDGWTRYYVYRIRLEKLKQRTWALAVVTKLLVFLASVASHC